jgi:hypothetical protein
MIILTALIIYYREDVDNIFLRNFGMYLPNYHTPDASNLNYVCVSLVENKPLLPLSNPK